MNTNMNNNKLIKRGDIFWVDFPHIEGSSLQYGKHPAVILQNEMGNKFSPNVQVCTLTSKTDKCKLPTQVLIMRDNMNKLTKDSVIQVESTTNVPKFLIGDYIGKLSNETMVKVNKAIAIQFGMKENIHVKKEVIVVQNIDMTIIDEQVFTIKKLKELFQLTQNQDLLRMYNNGVAELKRYCSEFGKSYKVYYNDIMNVDTNTNEKVCVAV